MIKVVSNVSQELAEFFNTLTGVLNSGELQRAISVGLVPVIRDRIHTQGQAADGSQIGTYSEEYMRVRTGQFKTNGVYKSGKRKGETRDAGNYSRGARKGTPRPKYNRTGETKVVASLTRQMENDMSVQATDDGGYGIGFNNPENGKKAAYVEETYGKKIYGLTAEESQLAVDYATNYLNQ